MDALCILLRSSNVCDKNAFLNHADTSPVIIAPYSTYLVLRTTTTVSNSLKNCSKFEQKSYGCAQVKIFSRASPFCGHVKHCLRVDVFNVIN